MQGIGAINGEDGKDGKDGIDGKDGHDGIDGFSPTITENQNNSVDSYQLDITNENGVFTTPNLLEKSSHPTTLSLTLPADGWQKETNEKILALGINFFYIYQTQIKDSSVMAVSAIVELSSSIIARNAGLASVLEYDYDNDGFLIIKLYSKYSTNENINLSVIIQY